MSQGRAERVREGLVQAGVPAERLTAVGYGHTRPLDTNRIPSGRVRNERIELVLLQP
ncbi:MAG: OmpA family protein [Deltaproteobacteria bacterium]|nr:OmpA family protein [Deltaproteobacteria bacterium]